MAHCLIKALESDRPVEVIRVEMNGEGSGEWDVVVNVRQIVALVKHPGTTSAQPNPGTTGLRLVPMS
jgi:hypothetical protein